MVRGRELAVGMKGRAGRRGSLGRVRGGRGQGRGHVFIPLTGRGANVVNVVIVVARGKQGLQLVMLLPQFHHPTSSHALSQSLSEGNDPLSNKTV